MKKNIFFLLLSLLFCSTTKAQQGTIIITEVLYDTPYNEDTRLTKDIYDTYGNPTNVVQHHNGEFVELYNPTNQSVDISGWTVGKMYSSTRKYLGRYKFPQGTIINPQGMLIVAYRHENTPNFTLEQLFPEIIQTSNKRILYHNDFPLNNKGDVVCLRNVQGKNIDIVSYTGAGNGQEWKLKALNGRCKKNLSTKQWVSIQRHQILQHPTNGAMLHTENNFMIDKATPLQLSENAQIPDISNWTEVELKNGAADSKTVGVINGAFNVSSTGAATYTIPIEVPPGANGMQPNIAITYNNQAGNGIAGFGTNISGLSAIIRVPKSIFYDNAAKGITYSDDDAFMLDGQRLILVSEETTGAVYNTESDPFTTITFKKTEGFEIKTKDGIRYIYGNTTNSQQIFSDKINAWYLSRVVDLFGNCINYGYTMINHYIYPSTISYGTASTSLNIVSFDYEYRPDVMPFKLETTNGNMGRRLSSITTKTGNDVFRKYLLNYYNKSSDHFSRLTSVTLKNGAGEELNPTYLNWVPLPACSITAKIPNNNDVNMTDSNFKKDINSITNIGHYTYSFISGDMNGDGLDDLIEIQTTKQSGDYHNAGHVYLAEIDNGNIKFKLNESLNIEIQPEWHNLNSEGSYNQGRLIADFDGDGINEFLSVSGNSSGLSFWSKTSTNKGTVKYKSSYFHSNKDAVFTTADINNDGRADIVIVEKTKLKIVKYDPSPSARNFEDYGTSYTISLSKDPLEVFAADFNGDGMVDIMAVHHSGYTIFWNNEGTFSDTNKRTETTIRNLIQSGNSKKMLCMNRIGDFNGDGLPDFICNRLSRDWYFALNNGDGTFTEQLPYTLPVDIREQLFTDKDDDEFECFVYDFDFDGKSDVVIVKAVYEEDHDISGSWGKNPITFTFWMRSTGTELSAHKVSFIAGNDNALSKYYTIGDFDGDGRPELMNYGYNCYTGNATQQWRIYQNPSLTANSGKLTSVIDGFGNTTTINYGSLTNTDLYKKGSGSAYPLVDIQPALPVVKSVSLSNGTAGSITTNYTYDTARVHLQGKGFIGFKKITANNPTLGIKTETGVTSLDDTYYYVPLKTYTKTTVGDETTQTNVEYSYIDKLNKKYFAYPKTITETDTYGNAATTTYTYDEDKGNLTQEETTYNNSSNYKKIDYEEYVQAGSTIENKPKKITITQKHSDDDDEFVNKTYFTYNDKGYPNQKTENYETSFAIITDYLSYDNVGNLTSYKISAESDPDINPITYNIEYDQTKRFVAKTTTEPATSVMTYHYDTWGNVCTEIDETNNANVLITSNTYNNWGQKTASTLPDGRKYSYTIQPDGIDNNFYFTETRGTGQPWSRSWYDATGRVIKTETIGAKDMAISATNTYNGKGQLKQTTTQQGNLTLTDKYEYDDFGRITKETKGSGQIIKYKYDNRSVTTETNERTYIQTFDAWGNVETATDPGGSVNYKYYSNGKPKEITAAGATIFMEYDEVGNQTILNDPNAGITTYKYNALGQLKEQTDAKNNITKNEYDNFNRLKYSLVNGERTDYTYGETGNEKLLLTKITKGNNSINYKYDKYGRIINEERFIEGESRSWFVGYNYDVNTGKLASKFFPALDIYVTNTYDTYGHLSTVNANSQTLWERTGKTGTQTTARVGGTMDFTTIYENNGFLSSQKAVKGNTTISYMSYLFDATTGNLDARIGINGSLEEFYYDKLDRLKGVETSTTELIAYLPNGNIDAKTGLGKYYYNNQPHAVTGIDNVDNLVSDKFQKIDYNAFNKVEKITEIVGNDEDVYVLEITYGPDQQRWKTVLTKNGEIEKTTIFAPNYEHITYADGTTKQFYYIYGGDGLAAIGINEKVQNVQTTKIYYAHLDHLGSIVKLTDNNGTEVFKASYDAWGVQTITKNDIGFHRGYTGHEHLPEFDLINMNGRMYDPVLGRMLSPDNYVQNPFNTQNYNRYSYCLNNPLKYTDPTGEKWWHWALGIGLAGDLGVGLFSSVTALTSSAAIPIFAGADAMTGGFLSASYLTTFPSSNQCYDLQKAISPIAVKPDFRIGNFQGGIGIDVSIGSPQLAPLSYRVHGGATYFWKNTDMLGNDMTGWETRYGGEWGTHGFTYSGTTFNSGWSGKQSTNTISLGNPLFNVRYENDMPSGVSLPGVPRGTGDEFRTAAVQINFGPFSIGTNMITGYGGPEKVQNAQIINGHETYIEYDEYNPNSHRMGTLYFGMGIFRTGVNSEEVRKVFQNRLAHDLITGGNSKWYSVLGIKPRWYWQFGYNGGGTLY